MHLLSYFIYFACIYHSFLCLSEWLIVTGYMHSGRALINWVLSSRYFNHFVLSISKMIDFVFLEFRVIRLFSAYTRIWSSLGVLGGNVYLNTFPPNKCPVFSIVHFVLPVNNFNEPLRTFRVVLVPQTSMLRHSRLCYEARWPFYFILWIHCLKLWILYQLNKYVFFGA